MIDNSNIDFKAIDWDQIHRDNPCVVTLGNFDGVHLGHRKILDTLMKVCNETGLEPVLVTFTPHPVQYFKRGKNFALINTVSEKLFLIQSSYPVQIYNLKFNQALSGLSPEEFITKFFKERLKAESFVFGYDHHFGTGGKGNARSLTEYGQINPERVKIVEPLQIDGINIGSTGIRHLIQSGKIEKANQLLGYRFFYSGKVVHGASRGRTLGFPTANVQVNQSHKILGQLGVYAAVAKLADKEYYAVVNVGKNPTFGDNKITIEAYLLDFNQNIYGRNLIIELISFLRKEMKFHTKEELINQIKRDINNFKQAFNIKTKSISG